MSQPSKSSRTAGGSGRKWIFAAAYLFSMPIAAAIAVTVVQKMTTAGPSGPVSTSVAVQPAPQTPEPVKHDPAPVQVAAQAPEAQAIMQVTPSTESVAAPVEQTTEVAEAGEPTEPVQVADAVQVPAPAVQATAPAPEIAAESTPEPAPDATASVEVQEQLADDIALVAADAAEPQEPAIEQPVAVEPAEPVAEQAVAVKPTEPVVTQPVVVEPAEPVVTQPVAAKPVEPVVAQPVAVKPAEPVVSQPVAVTQPVQEPVAAGTVEPQQRPVESIGPDSPLWWLQQAMEQVPALNESGKQRVGDTLLTAARLFAEAGQIDDYQQALEMWLATAQLSDAQRGKAAEVHIAAGDLVAAEAMATQITDPAFQVAALSKLASAKADSGDEQGYKALMQQAELILSTISEPAQAQAAQEALAAAATSPDDIASASVRDQVTARVVAAQLARGELETALASIERISDGQAAAQAQRALVRAVAEQGRFDEATTLAELIEVACQRAGAHVDIASIQLAARLRDDYRRQFFLAMSALEEATVDERIVVFAEVAKVQIRGGLHIDAEATISQIRQMAKEQGRSVRSLLDGVYFELAADFASGNRFGKAMRVIETDISDPQVRDRAVALVATAQAEAGVATAARRKADRISDPQVRFDAYRRICTVLAQGEHSGMLQAWIDSLASPDERLMAYVGAAEGLSAPRIPRSDSDSNEAIAAVDTP